MDKPGNMSTQAQNNAGGAANLGEGNVETVIQEILETIFGSPLALNPPLQTNVHHAIQQARGQEHDQSHLVAFAFYLNRYYLTNSDVSRGRLIKQALPLLEKAIMRARATSAERIGPYSLTQAKFWIQLVHAALVPFFQKIFSATEGIVLQQDPSLGKLDYSSFRYAIFAHLISECRWRYYYSEPVWYSLAARVEFQEPDLKSLPSVLPIDNLSLWDMMATFMSLQNRRYKENNGPSRVPPIDLPTELVLMIVKNLVSQRDIYALCLTSRILHMQLNSYLYRYNVQHRRSSALLWAARRGQEATMQRALKEGADAGTKSSFGLTPLALAAVGGHEAMVRLLIAHEDVDINSRDTAQSTPLVEASYYGHETITRLLLEREDIVANSRTRGGWTPLLSAAGNGHERVVRLLVGHEDVDADPDPMMERGQWFWTPLCYAAACGQESVVRLLIMRDDVKTDSRSGDQRTPLSYAAEHGNEAIVRLLLEQDDVNNKSRDRLDQTPLSHAAACGHAAVVHLLLGQDNMNAESRDSHDRTPLLHAAQRGHEAVVRLLLERNEVDVESRDRQSFTPLFYAVRHGHLGVVCLLLEQDDVNADIRDKHGWTPLSYAAYHGHDTIVHILLARNDVDADSRDNEGRTPLSRAAGKGRTEIVRLLANRDDVDADSKDYHNGWTPLSHAMASPHEAVVRLLAGRHDVDNAVRTPMSVEIARLGLRKEGVLR